MGRPKIAIIDDSVTTEEEKKTSKKSKTSVILNEEKDLPSSEENQTEEKTSPSMTQDQNDNKKSDNTENEIATSPSAPRNDKPKKPGKAKPRSKKYKEAVLDLDKSQTYPLNEAIELVKKHSYSKFVGTLEAHINTSQTGIRGLVSLPFATGKKLTILAFGTDAKDSGADIVGTEEAIEEINKGKVNFDLVVTTPEWMAKLAKVARILGPRGIMPNPKNGTITTDLKKAVEGFQSGKTEYKSEAKAPIVHMNLGKLDQPTEELAANTKALFITLGKSRVKKIRLTPTMGPSITVNISSI